MRIFLIQVCRLFNSSIVIVLTVEFGYDITISKIAIFDKVDNIDIEPELLCTTVVVHILSTASNFLLQKFSIMRKSVTIIIFPSYPPIPTLKYFDVDWQSVDKDCKINTLFRVKTISLPHLDDQRVAPYIFLTVYFSLSHHFTLSFLSNLSSCLLQNPYHKLLLCLPYSSVRYHLSEFVQYVAYCDGR